MSNKCKKCQSVNIELNRVYAYHDIYNCRDCNHAGNFPIEECCRKPYHIVTVHHHSYDLRPLYFQCLNCFGAEKTKPLKAKEYSEQIRAEFNQSGFEYWKTERKKENSEIYEGVKHSNYKNTKRYKYHEYLSSDKWKEKRKLVLERDKNVCQFCRLLQAVDVHHLHYNNLFNEPLEDLRGICLDCHHLIHNKRNSSVNP